MMQSNTKYHQVAHHMYYYYYDTYIAWIWVLCQNVYCTLQSFLLAQMMHCVILFVKESHLLPDKLCGEHIGHWATSRHCGSINTCFSYHHHFCCFLAHDRMSVMSLCNPDLSVIIVVIVVILIVVIVVCEHSSWPHAWPNKVHTLHAHAAISCIVAHQKLYHSDLYLLYSSHICMFTLMSIVHEVINIATLNLTKTCI